MPWKFISRLVALKTKQANAPSPMPILQDAATSLGEVSTAQPGTFANFGPRIRENSLKACIN